MRHASRESWNCIHQNKYSVQDDEYNYHESPQALLLMQRELNIFNGFIDLYINNFVLTSLHRS